MRLFGRLFRLVWGDEVDRALRPVLGVALAGSTAGSAVWTYIGIWSVEKLGASSAQLGVAFLIGAVSASIAGYVAFETVLPISAVNTHGMAPSTWGFLVIINPALVTLFQLRVTRRTEGFPRGPKLVLAMLLMGGSFLLLTLNGSAAMFALGPFIGLQLRGASGDNAAWVFFAAVSVAAAATGAAAVRAALGRRHAAPAPAS